MTDALGLLDVWRPLDATFSLRLPEVGDLIALSFVAWRVWDVSPQHQPPVQARKGVLT